jgi:hypothetical protein
MTILLEDFRPIRKFEELKLSNWPKYYFVYGDEFEPRYRTMFLTKEIYEIGSHKFFQTSEKVILKAHAFKYDYNFKQINGPDQEMVCLAQIVDEWTENCFTFKPERWNLSETGEESLSSNNLIFTDELDAGAFVIWLRERRGSE